MASKLYTEEQMRKTWNAAYTDALEMDEEDYKPKFFEDFIVSLTPIELPSDEEIKKEAQKLWGNVHRTGVLGFIECAKWMREQILNQNK